MNRYLKFYGILLLYVLLVHGFVTFIWPSVWPLLIALLLSQWIEPVVQRLSERGVPRGITALSLLSSIALLILFGTALLIAELRSELYGVLQSWPKVDRALSEFIIRWFAELRRLESELPPYAREFMLDQLGRANQKLAEWAESALYFVQAGFIHSIADLIFVIFFIFLSAFFLSKDRNRIWPFLSTYLPEQWRPGVRVLQTAFLSNLLRLIRIQMLLALGTWLLCYLYVGWVLGLPYALVLSLLAAALDFLPVVGPGMLFIPWSLWSFWNDQFWLAISLAAFFLGSSMARSYLQAHITGKEMGVHPLTMLLAAYLAVSVYGAAGFLIGPVAALVWVATIRANLWQDGIP